MIIDINTTSIKLYLIFIFLCCILHPPCQFDGFIIFHNVTVRESSLGDAEDVLSKRDQVLRNVVQHCLHFCSLTSFSVCGKQGAHIFPPMLSDCQTFFFIKQCRKTNPCHCGS